MHLRRRRRVASSCWADGKGPGEEGLRLNLPVGVLKTVSHGVKAFGRMTGPAVVLTPEKSDMLLQHFVCSSDSAQSPLGWEPRVPLAEGLKLTVAWYRQNNWL